MQVVSTKHMPKFDLQPRHHSKYVSRLFLDLCNLLRMTTDARHVHWFPLHVSAKQSAKCKKSDKLTSEKVFFHSLRFS